MTRPATVDSSFVFGPLVENEHMVWSKPNATWAWQLTPLAGDRTRLVTRLRQRYLLTPALPVTVGLMELADFPMMRKMLRGIRERAEQPTPLCGGAGASDDVDEVEVGCQAEVRHRA